MIKIKVEHDDIGEAAVIGAIIADALERHDFKNVKAKMVMVYQSQRKDLVPDGGKASQLTPLIDPAIELCPKTYVTELLPARIAYGYPVMYEWARESRPQMLDAPVLIDTGLEPGPYQQQLKDFEAGNGR